MLSNTLFGVVFLLGLLNGVERNIASFAFGGALAIMSVVMLVLLYKRAQEHQGEAWLINGLRQLLEAQDA